MLLFTVLPLPPLISDSFPDWLVNFFRAILPCNLWPFIVDTDQFPVSSPPPESSSSPVATDPTTEPMRSTWPNPTFIVDTDQFPVSSPPPESSSPPVATDLTTQPPSGSSSDDNTLRTIATMRSTGPDPTFTLGPHQFVTGVASFHSVCIWMLLYLTILATVVELV